MDYLPLTKAELIALPEPNKESDLQKIVVAYYRKFIKPIYPDSRLISNPFADQKLNFKQINIAKSKGFERSQPDLIFIQKIEEFSGFAQELKTKKSGVVRNKHTLNQGDFLQSLSNSGFYVTFSTGLIQSLTHLCLFFGDIEGKILLQKRFNEE